MVTGPEYFAFGTSGSGGPCSGENCTSKATVTPSADGRSKWAPLAALLQQIARSCAKPLPSGGATRTFETLPSGFSDSVKSVVPQYLPPRMTERE